ncbi:MAG: hypothetical protein WCP39_01810 [Chlamydiota bacterium]
MESFLISSHYDLITPDGLIQEIKSIGSSEAIVHVHIKNISPAFVGFQIDLSSLFFNLKSTLAQLGLHGATQQIVLDSKYQTADVQVQLLALTPIATTLLSLLSEGAYIGKLFAADERRKVRNPEYLTRMLGRCDQAGNPLLSFGHPHGRDDLILEKIDGYTIAFLPVKKGIITYKNSIENFIPTLAEMLKHKHLSTRNILHLHQIWENQVDPIIKPNKILLVRTTPLHIRTVFAKVVDSLLPQGVFHTSASVLQPDTQASGDIYEFFSLKKQELKTIPLEFYTLEPHREYVFFSDRDQLLTALEHPENLFDAFKTAPNPGLPASVFIVKGEQLKNLKPQDWITRDVYKHDFPGLNQPARQALLIEKYIEQQPYYPFLNAIINGLITSQGILLSRYFLSPLTKRLLLSQPILRCLKAIYFQIPSRSFDYYFSHEDRAFLADLAKFAIPVFWVDTVSGNLLKYVVKPEKDTGMFVPISLAETFTKATFFGVYGSNLLKENFENEIYTLLKGVIEMKPLFQHPFLSKDTPLALVTGGGPGAMEIGNKVAKNLHILSCANIVDFRPKSGAVVNEQKRNPHVEGIMTYRLDRLVERQAEFHLDFPIFLTGGIGTDFEFALEQVRRKVGSCPPNPIILFGPPSYWEEKITSCFQCNRKHGTIKGSEWVSNCFYSIQTAEQGIEIYRAFFEGTLPIGVEGPIYEKGFCESIEQIPFKNRKPI